MTMSYSAPLSLDVGQEKLKLAEHLGGKFVSVEGPTQIWKK